MPPPVSRTTRCSPNSGKRFGGSERLWSSTVLVCIRSIWLPTPGMGRMIVQFLAGGSIMS